MGKRKKRKVQHPAIPILQYSSIPVPRHPDAPIVRYPIVKYLLCFSWVVLWLVMGNPVAYGARVAGEEGVTPAAPKGAMPPASPPAAEPVEEAVPVTPTVPKAATPPVRPSARKPAAVKPPAPAPKRPVQAQQKAPPRKESPKQEQAPTKEAPSTRYVNIDFDNVDIELLIKFISEQTGKNFVVDKAVRGKVTIISPTKISVEEAYRVFESVLEVHGFTTVPAGNVIKIVPSVQARSKNIETRLREEAIDPEDKVVTQLIPLEYANPDELKKLFAPLISKNSVIISYPPTGILIVTDVLSNIKRLLSIVKAIDVVGIGEEISVVPVVHATASVLVKSLTTVFGNDVRKKGRAATPGVKIVSDERTNSLIIAASEHDTLRVRELLKLLDKEIPRGEGDIHVYYLQNASAEDMAKVLTALPSKEAKAGQQGKAPVISKEVQIVADKSTNSLVITANKDDYLILEDVIKKLDIVRRMVYIEALLMEVSVSKDFDVGVQWLAGYESGSTDGQKIVTFGGSTPSSSIFPTANAAGQVSLPTGLSVGVLGEAITIAGIDFPNIGAVVRAFQSDSDVNILSNPQIMTTDNEEAEIVVADNIPFLTRQETSTAGVDYSNYEFKDVGVTLNITPQINQERFVRLQISQEVSQVVEQDQIGLPTTLKRQAKTTVIIKDSHTVVFGGLISETLNQGTYQVPCLGSIPLFGWLFKTRSRSSDQKNLYIFLTPHIVENPQEAKTIFEQKKGKIDSIREGSIKMYERPGTRGKKPEVEPE